MKLDSGTELFSTTSLTMRQPPVFNKSTFPSLQLHIPLSGQNVQVGNFLSSRLTLLTKMPNSQSLVPLPLLNGRNYGPWSSMKDSNTAFGKLCGMFSPLENSLLKELLGWIHPVPSVIILKNRWYMFCLSALLPLLYGGTQISPSIYLPSHQSQHLNRLSPS